MNIQKTVKMIRQYIASKEKNFPNDYYCGGYDWIDMFYSDDQIASVINHAEAKTFIQAVHAVDKVAERLQKAHDAVDASTPYC